MRARDADADDLGRPAVHRRRSPVITCIIDRGCAACRASLLGVADRRARVGHEHVVERRPRDADRRGSARPARRTAAGRTASPVGDVERHRALGRPRPRCRSARRSAAIAASSSSVSIRTRSAPTLAFSAAGVSSATISPLVHDRDPVAELGLVHVVRGHEDRDLLAPPAARGCSARSSCASAGRGRSSARRGTARAASACRPRAISSRRRMPPENVVDHARRGAPTGRPSPAPAASAARSSSRLDAVELGVQLEVLRRRSGSRRASGPGRRGRCGGGRRRARVTTSWPATQRAAAGRLARACRAC